MIDVATGMGVAVTPIEGRPTSRLRGVTLPPYEVPLDTFPRWQRHLEGSVGVLTGLNLVGRPHAVVWDGYQCLDPASGEKYGIHLFQPDVFWRCTILGASIRAAFEAD